MNSWTTGVSRVPATTLRLGLGDKSAVEAFGRSMGFQCVRVWYSRTPAPSELRRVLRLRDLIFYGIVVITPIAPVNPIFGIAQELSRGHVILTLLIAGVAMMLTAFSYGAGWPICSPSAAESAYVYWGVGSIRHPGILCGMDDGAPITSYRP